MLNSSSHVIDGGLWHSWAMCATNILLLKHSNIYRQRSPISWHHPYSSKTQGHTSAQNSAYMSFAVSFVTGQSLVTEQRSQAVIIKPMTRSLEHSNTKPVSTASAHLWQGRRRPLCFQEWGLKWALIHGGGRKHQREAPTGRKGKEPNTCCFDCENIGHPTPSSMKGVPHTPVSKFTDEITQDVGMAVSL